MNADYCHQTASGKGTLNKYFSVHSQLGMSAQELTLLLLTVFLCKYTKVLWLCKSKGFYNFLMRVWQLKN